MDLISGAAVGTIIKIGLLIFFIGIYAYTAVIGTSIFLHFRWFGLRDKSQKVVEGLFIALSAAIFLWNVGLLFSF
jgi:hypothetical protein